MREYKIELGGYRPGLEYCADRNVSFVVARELQCGPVPRTEGEGLLLNALQRQYPLVPRPTNAAGLPSPIAAEKIQSASASVPHNPAVAAAISNEGNQSTFAPAVPTPTVSTADAGGKKQSTPTPATPPAGAAFLAAVGKNIARGLSRGQAVRAAVHKHAADHAAWLKDPARRPISCIDEQPGSTPAPHNSAGSAFLAAVGKNIARGMSLGRAVRAAVHKNAADHAAWLKDPARRPISSCYGAT